MTGDSRGDAEGIEREWLNLLEWHSPPHADADWFTPLFWPLLQAMAAEPILRAGFPARALNAIGVVPDADWWGASEAERRRWPMIATGSSGIYTVCTDITPHGSRELFATEDPHAAAAYLAEIVAKLRAGGA
jgi:hypothetical protein